MDPGKQAASSTEETRTGEKLLNDLKVLVQRAEQKVLEQAKAADSVVRDHPYPIIGAAFGLGLLLGFVVRRK
jgi:ElaB/YqjD/DUF883 family membrane-anchored ribosome-binding protein